MIEGKVIKRVVENDKEGGRGIVRALCCYLSGMMIFYTVVFYTVVCLCVCWLINEVNIIN